MAREVGKIWSHVSFRVARGSDPAHTSNALPPYIAPPLSINEPSGR